MKVKGEVIVLENIIDLEWDILIVFDACRYDYFAKTYQEFFRGVLIKGVSLATKTEEWVKAQFKERYENIVYVSANPIINSRIPVWGFDAKKYFYKVIDVWDWGWDEEYGTVPPWNVNKAVIEAFRKYPDKRLIIHYMQPHAPYLPIAYLGEGFKIENPFALVGLGALLRANRDSTSRENFPKFLYLLMNLIKPLLPKQLPRQSIIWKLRKLLSIPPRSPEEIFYRMFSIREIQAMYELNLRFVLKYAGELVRQLLRLKPGLKIIITADHGELLGERGEIGHDVGHNLPNKYVLTLREVPWFRVSEPKVPIQWYGSNPISMRFVKYFMMAERNKLKKIIRARIRRLRREYKL